jgi:small subunit ribosomal protein S16
MAVKIRLARIGKKKAPFYRLVAIDERKKRDGECLDNLGTYDALKGAMVTFNEELYNQWKAQGAQPTDSVKKLVKKARTAQAATTK